MDDNRRFCDAVRRMIRAAYKRMEGEDPEELGFSGLSSLVSFCSFCEAECIRKLRASGYTWDHIANVYGITRQAAFQRWGSKF